SRMSAFTTVLKKEILDSSRERRAMLSGLVFGPLFGPVMFATIMAFTVERSVDEGEEPIDVPVLNASYAPNLVAHLEQHLIHVDGFAFETREALRESVRRGRMDVGLVIDPAYGEALANAPIMRPYVRSADETRATALRVALFERCDFKCGASIRPSHLPSPFSTTTCRHPPGGPSCCSA
ncbi:MAG: hypothetical protein P8Y95_11175, partial [Gammaproteobacteria bacterium]